MPDTMTSTYDDGGRIGRADVLGVQRRMRWTPEEKVRIVEVTYLPGHSVSLVARRHGIAANQLFAWHRLRCGKELRCCCDSGTLVWTLPGTQIPRWR